MIAAIARRPVGVEVAAVAIGLWSAAVALAPDTAVAIALTAPAVVLCIGWWAVLAAHRWLMLLFAVALLTPPLPFPIGTAGPHLAPAAALLGLFIGVLRLSEWKPVRGGLSAMLAVFLLFLLASVAAAALYSGPAVAAGSLARVALLGISVYVFVYTSAGPPSGADPVRLTGILFGMGVIAAAFACIDFYYQLPAPAGYGAQFVWLDTGVFKRAQGLFYEASTLGNFCAFFIVMIVVALFFPAGYRPVKRGYLVAGGAVFCAALILSYSRASVVNVVIALSALAYIRRIRMRRLFAVVLASGGIAAIAVFAFLPTFATSYWLRLSASFEYFWSTPNAVLSGRLTTWATLLNLLAAEPWHALFGIGYKTLPLSDIAGAPVIADNTYLSLLVETGVAGLAVFVTLNLAILAVSLRSARSINPRAAFFGSWIFCFWTGQMVQMLSGDLITYWRVLPVYFWVLAVAVRESCRDEHPLR